MRQCEGATLNSTAVADSGYGGVFRRNPDFARLFAAQVVKFCGDWFLTVSLLGLVWEMTESGTLVALLVVCQSLPSFLLAPYGGTVVDRVDRRRLMIGVDLVAAGMALLALLARSTATLPFAYLAVIGISSTAAFFQPAAQASLPNVVQDDDLAKANVLNGSIWGTMLAVGAALGGLVAATLGRSASIVIDSACLLTSALILLSIKRPFQGARSGERTPFLPALREAVGYAAKRPPVLALLTAKGGYGISVGSVALLSVFALDVFDMGDIGTGILYGARGLGALAGPFLIRRIGGSDARTFGLIGVGSIVYGLGYALFAVMPAFWLAAAFVTVAHLGGGALWTMSSYGLQRAVPDALRGRIFAADFGLVTLTISISSVVAGLLADSLGPTPAVFILGSLALLWGAVWTLWTRGLFAANSDPAPAAATSGAPVEQPSTRA